MLSPLADEVLGMEMWREIQYDSAMIDLKLTEVGYYLE